MKPVRVVVVDDSPVFRESLCEFLKQHSDIELVGTAASGSEAVRKAEELAPDLLIMDLVMPEMNGLEATRLIKAAPVHRPKVILVTLHEPRPFAKAAASAGADGFVRKAEIPRLLFPMIHHLCRPAATSTATPEPEIPPGKDDQNHGPAGSAASLPVLGAVL
jgi:DNA-binding NarL/FixJ family response regulator